MNDQETLYTIALTRIPRLNSVHHHILLENAGSATALYESRNSIRDIIPNANRSLCEAVATIDAQLPSAEKELELCQQKHIQCLGMNDPAYPTRLHECPDSPVMLYFCGNANMNAKRIISIVGTRKITEYGKDICLKFLAELKRLIPDALIVSGLAYGVDIHAHRNALQQHLPTVGVLAHGLDQIYPRIHRDSAVEMVRNGGLLTEYPLFTPIDKMRFVARNRIVAGMADATIVVESAEKGGSLITARIANQYNRDVFAFPGRITDLCSAGCNILIMRNEANAINNAQGFIEQMGWMSDDQQKSIRQQSAQLDLFPELTAEEQRVAAALKNVDEKAINILSIDTNIPIGQLTGLLFAMEMKGVVKMMNGGTYRLLQ